MSRPRQTSITRRLLLATVASLPLFLGLTGYSIDRAHTSSLLAAEQDRLRLHFYSLLGVMEWEDNGNLSMERLKEPSFWQFRSGLYAIVTSPDGQVQWLSPSAETRQLPFNTTEIPPPGKEQFEIVDDPNAPFFRFRYHILWEDDSGEEIPLVFTLLSSQKTFRVEQESFRREITLWLSGAALILLAIQAGILRWGLAPLRRLAGELRQLEKGHREQLTEQYPRELAGITRNLNRLLDKEHKQRERYRNTLADLAHSLKTPLTVMKALLNGERFNRQAADEQLQRMDSIIAYQLQRAVSAGGRQLGSKTAVAPLVDRLLTTMRKVHADKAVRAENVVADHAAMAIDEHDLMELLGNLLDNAFKACRSTVIVGTEHDAPKDTLVIEDDGPGIPRELADRMVERGQRGDQYGAGQGLGLAIVMDIVEAYGGDIRFSTSSLGGTAVRITISASH